MVAYLVETTPVKKVVEKVKAGRTKPKEEVIQSSKLIPSSIINRSLDVKLTSSFPFCSQRHQLGRGNRCWSSWSIAQRSCKSQCRNLDGSSLSDLSSFSMQLSFSRIGTPIRSRLCNHISCFDAETWFEMNEQTPTWGCPICSKTLKFEDMVVDG